MPKGAAAGEYDQSGSELGPLRPGSSLENPTSIRSSDAGIGDWQTSSQSNIGDASHPHHFVSAQLTPLIQAHPTAPSYLITKTTSSLKPSPSVDVFRPQSPHIKKASA